MRLRELVRGLTNGLRLLEPARLLVLVVRVVVLGEHVDEPLQGSHLCLGLGKVEVVVVEAVQLLAVAGLGDLYDFPESPMVSRRTWMPMVNDTNLVDRSTMRAISSLRYSSVSSLEVGS